MHTLITHTLVLFDSIDCVCVLVSVYVRVVGEESWRTSEEELKGRCTDTHTHAHAHDK